MVSGQRASFISVVSIACLCATLVVQVRPSVGAPGSVLNATDPLKAAPPQETRALGVGDMSVASRTGAFEYSYPIVVPPGRLGNQPNLALNYSSQGALRGGIAAGWSLSIPEIKLEYPEGKFDPTGDSDEVYTSSLAGGHRLVPVEGALSGRYRAEYDDQYIRYTAHELVVDGLFTTAVGRFNVRTLDETLYRFGGLGNPTSETRWPLTWSFDRYDNAVDYHYNAISADDGTEEIQEYVLDYIEYGRNNPDGIEHFAKVEFESSEQSACPGAVAPPGASFNQRAGHLRTRGVQKLTAIRTYVKDNPGDSYRPVRVVKLNYDSEAERCDAHHGPLRMLTSIQEFAPTMAGDPTPGSISSGNWMSTPPVAFGYGHTHMGSPIVSDRP